MRTLYLECNSGISGDMTAAALLDLGADREGLLEMLDGMPLHGFHVEIGRTEKCGISACDFEVVLDEEPHTHRHLADVYEIIEQTDTADSVKALARRMFEIVAEAEAKAHDVPVEKVHFHEVGAVDSIVDIMSAAYLIESLHIDRAVVSELHEGRGQVRCQHGILPVPVPAVVNIVQSCGLPMRLTDTEGEMITPTGAAIAAVLQEYGQKNGRESRGEERSSCEESRRRNTPFGKQGCIGGRLLGIGTGAGKKDFPHANILRAMLFEENEAGKERLWMLETNVDDCTGEALGYVSEKLLEAGARDVTFSPIFMKKNRPAYLLAVLCGEAERERLEDLIFLHTTTIGIRRYEVERRTLPRESLTAETSYGAVRMKRIERPDGVRCVPEYENVREICDRTGAGFAEVYEAIKRETADMQLNDDGGLDCPGYPE